MGNIPYQLVNYRGKFCVYWREDDGSPRRISLRTSDKELAEKRFSGFLREISEQKRDKYSIAELWELRRESLKGRRTYEGLEYTGRLIIPSFGTLPCSAINQLLIDNYIQLRESQGKKQGTILTELSHLRDTLSWAKKTGLISDYPYFKLPPAPPPKTEYITKEQAREFLDAIDTQHVYVFSVIALTTGARSSAILDLTWDRVDFSKRLIHLAVPGQVFKKGRPVVPMNDLLFKTLSQFHTEGSTGHVIMWAGERVRSIKKALQKVSSRTGIRVTPHMFRHSAAVWMAEAGVSMSEISQFLGHSSTSITEKVYARFSPDYLRKAAGALNL